MTDKQRLEKINKLLDTDVAFDADCVRGGITAPSKEACWQFANLLIDIYKTAHPNRKCPHDDWDKVNE